VSRRVKALLESPRSSRTAGRRATSAAEHAERDASPALSPTSKAQPLVDSRPVVQQQVALGREAARSPRAARQFSAAPAEGVVQRQLALRAPTKPYRKAGGSASARLNAAIDAYNSLLATNATLDAKLAALETVRGLMAGISPKKRDFRDRLAALVDREEQVLRGEARAVQDVMALARARAQLQAAHPLANQPHEVAPQVQLETLEVLHALDPRRAIGGGATVGDALAASREIRNVHQTGHSSVGGDTDSAKRKTAEIGTFYPERYRRGSFSRTAHQNPSATKGLEPALLPPDQALPKYAAINIAHSPFGAFESGGDREAFPLHLAIRPSVLAERATMTASDSLRAWTPYESNNTALNRMGALQDPTRQMLPRDEQPWETVPTASFGGESTSHVLRAATGGRRPDTNPADYVEVQIHGQLRIDRDIEHVRANFFALFGEPRFESLYRLLSESGIAIHWYFRDDEGRVMEENLVTQPAGGAGGFAAAWREAAVIRRESDAAFERRGKRGGKSGEELQSYLETAKSINILTETARQALKAVWDGLRG
jgi:hypothetical protein